VASEGKSTVFTAAHCVEEQDIGGGGAVGPAATIHFTNIAFEPGYRAGISPWGVFPARHIEDTHYEDWFDITHDFAAMSVWGNSAGNVVDLAGGQGVAWDQPRTQTSHVWGYPKGEVGDGEHLMHCVGTQRPDPAFTPAEDILLHDCISDFGGSGGAWLAGYRAGAGLGTVVGVTSGADLTLRVKAAHLTGGFHSLSYDAVRYDGGLNRYKASNGESWTTSRQPLPAGYSYERTLGSLFTSNAFSGRIPLYTCVSGSDHYLSKLPTCDGGTSLGLDGYALTPTGLQPAATYGLYRCRRQITNDRFVSNDPACEGGTFDQLLGYAVGSNALVRYYNGTSHRVTTNRIFGGGFANRREADGRYGRAAMHDRERRNGQARAFDKRVHDVLAQAKTRGPGRATGEWHREHLERRDDCWLECGDAVESFAHVEHEVELAAAHALDPASVRLGRESRYLMVVGNEHGLDRFERLEDREVCRLAERRWSIE